MKETEVLDKIDSLCRQKGWSHYRLSMKSGIPLSTLNNMFLRTNVPTIPTLMKLCHAFDMTLSQFFADEGTAPSLTPDQEEVLILYSQLGPKDRGLAKAYLMGLNHQNPFL